METTKVGRTSGRAAAAGPRRLKRELRLVPDALRKVEALESLFRETKDDLGRRVFGAKCGVYAFFDFDGEPIYVGQTYEGLQTRIRRHLTNQRTDPVAMHVLDPVEVAEIRVWPMYGVLFERRSGRLTAAQEAERDSVLDRLESTVHAQLVEASSVHAILNEKTPGNKQPIELPASYGGKVVPSDAVDRLYHRDERIARRAETIADLARVVKERDVSIGLRHTLLTQAQRLELLARQRLEEVRGEMTREELKEETVGSDDDSVTLADE